MMSLRLAPSSLRAAVAVVAAPVVVADPLAAAPHPVEAEVSEIDVAARTVGSGAEAEITLERTSPFSMLAVSWHRPEAPVVSVEVRTRADGVWSDWILMDVADAFPDSGTADSDGIRAATTPLWTGPSDGVQVRAEASGGTPEDLRVDLIDPGTSPADGALGRSATPLSAASAASVPDGRPAVITRAEWGADESLRLGACPEGPKYTDPPRVAFVHHTASGNGYSVEATAAAIRGIYAYSVNTRGYCDIPYNFIVDKFGRIFEGRAGGIDAPVLGAATGGFNTASTAVAALGTYSTVAPSAAMVSSIGIMAGWKLGRYGRDPLGTTTLTASGGAGTTAKYADGAEVTVPIVSGHRQVGATECPGDLLFPQLEGIRTQAVAVARATPIMPPPQDVRSFVKALYADYLDRSPVDIEVTYWADLVYRGRLSRQAAAAGFTGAPEWTRTRVAGLYRDVLGRDPDPGGLSYWSGLLGQDPARLAWLTAHFYSSQEWYLLSGGTDLKWAEGVYAAILGRGLDPGGRELWLPLIKSAGRQVVASSVLQSRESLVRRVSALYRGMLGREAEPSGIDYWTPTVSSVGDIVLSNALAASEEYFSRAAVRFPASPPNQ